MGLLLHVSSGLGCVVVELSLWERPASTGQYYGYSERKFRFFTRGTQPSLVKKESSLEEEMFKRRVRILNRRCQWGSFVIQGRALTLEELSMKKGLQV